MLRRSRQRLSHVEHDQVGQRSATRCGGCPGIIVVNDPCLWYQVGCESSSSGVKVPVLIFIPSGISIWPGISKIRLAV